MNIERLHRILIDLDHEIESNNLTELLTNLQNHLQNQVNNPQDANHQKKLSQTITQIDEKLENSEYNNYSPSWRQVIDEIGGESLFGLELKEEINTIFARNQITAANALEEIKVIVQNFKTLQHSIKKTLEGLQGLNIGEEELEEGECELGYTIPREFIENRLEGLEDEIHELNFILNTVGEAVTGKKENYEVKTISSSDFLLYINITLSIGAVFTIASERILNIYKRILEIKKLRNELKEKGVPANQTKGVEKHANGLMEKEIKKIAKEVMDEHYNGDNGRKNELENGLTFAFNKLANRIDSGFNVEIRIEPLQEHEETDEDDERDEEVITREEKIRSISESAKKIEYIKTEGKAILQLPEEKKK